MGRVVTCVDWGDSKCRVTTRRRKPQPKPDLNRTGVPPSASASAVASTASMANKRPRPCGDNGGVEGVNNSGINGGDIDGGVGFSGVGGTGGIVGGDLKRPKTGVESVESDDVVPTSTSGAAAAVRKPGAVMPTLTDVGRGANQATDITAKSGIDSDPKEMVVDINAMAGVNGSTGGDKREEGKRQTKATEAEDQEESGKGEEMEEGGEDDDEHVEECDFVVVALPLGVLKGRHQQSR